MKKSYNITTELVKKETEEIKDIGAALKVEFADIDYLLKNIDLKLDNIINNLDYLKKLELNDQE